MEPGLVSQTIATFGTVRNLPETTRDLAGLLLTMGVGQGASFA